MNETGDSPAGSPSPRPWGALGGDARPEQSSNRSRIAPKTSGGFSPDFRPIGLPPIVLTGADGQSRLAPYLMSRDDVADFFRLAESKTRFPRATIARYVRMGLRTVRVGRRKWFRLDDVLRFLDDQQRAERKGLAD